MSDTLAASATALRSVADLLGHAGQSLDHQVLPTLDTGAPGALGEVARDILALTERAMLARANEARALAANLQGLADDVRLAAQTYREMDDSARRPEVA